ncbi:MAG: hypothetical protein MZU91_03450 [Desulfosudis oleivorans]|nr:hypothetical protein [Desulfosudis oleivorans]
MHAEILSDAVARARGAGRHHRQEKDHLQGQDRGGWPHHRHQEAPGFLSTTTPPSCPCPSRSRTTTTPSGVTTTCAPSTAGTHRGPHRARSHPRPSATAQYSATGGQADFVRGALASKGGKSFIRAACNRQEQGRLSHVQDRAELRTRNRGDHAEV